jgi:hypothetical protein
VFLLEAKPDRIAPIQPCIIAIIFYNGTEEEGRMKYKRFLDLSMPLWQPYGVETHADIEFQIPSQI